MKEKNLMKKLNNWKIKFKNWQMKKIILKKKKNHIKVS
jgi:hypothetical protein